MDVADGSAGDSGRRCGPSRVAAEIAVARVPRSDGGRAALAEEPALIETILTGGDDYEGVACVPAGKGGALRRQASAAGLAGTEVGAVPAGARGGPALPHSRPPPPSRQTPCTRVLHPRPCGAR